MKNGGMSRNATKTEAVALETRQNKLSLEKKGMARVSFRG